MVLPHSFWPKSKPFQTYQSLVAFEHICNPLRKGKNQPTLLMIWSEKNWHYIFTYLSSLLMLGCKRFYNSSKAINIKSFPFLFYSFYSSGGQSFNLITVCGLAGDKKLKSLLTQQSQDPQTTTEDAVFEETTEMGSSDHNRRCRL